MDREAWKAAVHGVAKSQTRLSDFTFTFHINALETEMAIHSSVLAWRSPGMVEPGGLQFMGSLSRTQLSDFTFTFHFHALEKEMATHSSVLAWRSPGMAEPSGLPSWGRTESDRTEMMLWGRKELDTTEGLSTSIILNGEGRLNALS